MRIGKNTVSPISLFSSVFDKVRVLLPSSAFRDKLIVEEGVILSDSQSENSNDQTKNYPHAGGDKGSYSYLLGREVGKEMFFALQDAQKSIKIISPFLSKDMVDELLIKKSQCDIKLITSISIPEKSLFILRKLFHLYHDKEYRLLFDTVFFKGTQTHQTNKDDNTHPHYNDDSIHQKVYIFDEKVVFLGSVNFTYPSVHKNFETVVIFKEIDIVENIINYFNDLFCTDIIKKWEINELINIIQKNDNKGESYDNW